MTNNLDDIIPGLIKAGREAAENYQNSVYMTQTWEQVYDSFPEMPIEIRKPPLQSLESVTIIDETGQPVTVNSTDFAISTRSHKIGFKPDKGWPNITLQKFDSVIFTFKAGYTDVSKVPESVKLAIKLFVNYYIDNPDAAIDEPPEAFYRLLGPERRVPV